MTRTIDTAPRDGTVIWAGGRWGIEHCRGKWIDGRWHFWFGKEDGWLPTLGDPTHWMPCADKDNPDMATNQ